MDHSRRKFLKVMAAAPAVLIAGMSVSPILRFLKPTMGPMGFFEPADIPRAESTLTFPTNYFPEPWVWFPFMFPLKIAEFNPEQKEVREIPGLAVKLPNNEIVAYSRVCPIHGRACVLGLLSEPELCHAGCFLKLDKCRCVVKVSNPVLFCPCTGITFDLANGARPVMVRISGPEKFVLRKQRASIEVVSLEINRIL